MTVRGHYSVAGLLCLTMIAGCTAERDSGSGASETGQPAFSVTTSTVPSPPSTSTAVRGTVTFALTTKDGYRGTVKLTAHEPVVFKNLPEANGLTECTPYPDATRTALIRVDFTFTDQSPPNFPWKLGWGTDSLGSGGRVLATRSGPREPYACRQPSSWSGNGTMSVLLAMDDYFSPNAPKGDLKRLHDVGVSFPLVGGVRRDEITITATSGNTRGDVSDVFSPALQIAFGPERRG